MTSKNSFFKKMDKSLYMPSLFLNIFYAFLYVFAFVIFIQNRLEQTTDHVGFVENITEAFAPDVVPILFIFILAAFDSFSVFQYLHSRTKIDFYHSLPVKRRTRFRSLLGYSLLLFVIPLSIAMAIQMVIATVLGCMSATLLSNTLASFCMYTLIYSFTYLTGALACIMTGQIIIAVLAMGVFMTYFPFLVGMIYPSYGATFFQTYLGNNEAKWLNNLSPLGLLFRFQLDDTWSWSDNILPFAICIVWIVVLTILTRILFEKRASESAGKAMAFKKTQAVIRILIIIPLAMYCGLYLYMATLSASIIWLLVGIILGTVFFHGFMEAVYQFDIKAAFSHKLQLLATTILCLLLSTIFWMDLTGYETMIPKQDQIASVSIITGNYSPGKFWSDQVPVLDGEDAGILLEQLQHIVDEKLYTTQHYDEVNVTEAINAVEATTDVTASTNSKDDTRDTSIQNSNTADPVLTTLQNNYENYVNFQVDYTLKNGTTRRRAYTLHAKDAYPLLSKLYESREYKVTQYPLYTAKAAITKIVVYTIGNSASFNLSASQQEELIDLMLEEITAMTYEETLMQAPVCQIAFTRTITTDTQTYSTNDTYCIYPSFAKTIAYLKEHGVPEIHTLRDYEIVSIDIQNLQDNGESYFIEDPEVISKVKDVLEYNDFSDDYQPIYRSDKNYSVYVTFKNGASEDSCCVRIPPEALNELIQSIN